jgi:hypothetical protein
MAADFREAARRIRTIGNWTLLIGGSLEVISLFFAAAHSTSIFLNTPIVHTVLEFVIALMPGVVIRLLAWIVDGLAGPSRTEEIEQSADRAEVEVTRSRP